MKLSYAGKVILILSSLLMLMESVMSKRTESCLLTTIVERGDIVKVLKLLGVRPEGYAVHASNGSLLT